MSGITLHGISSLEWSDQLRECQAWPCLCDVIRSVRVRVRYGYGVQHVILPYSVYDTEFIRPSPPSAYQIRYDDRHKSEISVEDISVILFLRHGSHLLTNTTFLSFFNVQTTCNSSGYKGEDRRSHQTHFDMHTLTFILTLLTSFFLLSSSEPDVPQDVTSNEVSGVASADSPAEERTSTFYNGIEVPPITMLNGETFEDDTKDGYW